MGKVDWSNKEQALEMIKQDSANLLKAGEELRGDRDFVMAVVKENGYALEYAPEECRDDKEIVLAALKEEPYAFEYVSERLQVDMDVIKVIFTALHDFTMIPHEFYDRKDIQDFLFWATNEVIVAINDDEFDELEFLWESLPGEMSEDEGLIEAAIEYSPEPVFFLDEYVSYFDYYQYCLLAIEKHPYDPVFSWLPEYLRDDEEFILEALDCYPELFVNDSSRQSAQTILSDEAFVTQAIENHPEVYHYMDKALQEKSELKEAYQRSYKGLDGERKAQVDQIKEKMADKAH